MIPERELVKLLRKLLPARDRWSLDDLAERLAEGRGIEKPGQFRHHIIECLHKMKRNKLAVFSSGYWRSLKKKER